MIRIVGIQRHSNPDQEFVLFQNQGSLKHMLRGHLVIGQGALDGVELANCSHLFRDEVHVPPGMYVLLTTGNGNARWAKTKDGAMVYYAYMSSPCPVWERLEGPVHVLGIQHSFVERTQPAMAI